MTQRKPWEPDNSPPNAPFSSLHPRDQQAMKMRLEDVLAELRSAVPANEALARQKRPTVEAVRKSERAAS